MPFVVRGRQRGLGHRDDLGSDGGIPHHRCRPAIGGAGTVTPVQVAPILDLTDHVVAAALARGAWDIGMVKCWWDSGLDVREPFEIDWDSDAGEGWALLVTGGVVKGFLWACGPLAIVASDTPAAVRSKLERLGVEVVLLSNLDEPVLSLRQPALDVLAESSPWPPDVSAGRMSACELWWATV